MAGRDPSVPTSPRDDSHAALEAFRRWGYLQADLDWLGRLPPLPHPELDAFGDAAPERRAYCGTLAVEFMHIPDPARRRWIQERMESPAPSIDPQPILEQLIRAETLERVLQSRYIGNKRFSIEGIESLIPMLREVLETSAERGGEQVVLGMSHRGRLNVMAHVVGVDPVSLLAGFEDVDPRSVLGAGDVKYHKGATGVFRSRGGRELRVHLVSNPSHLEAVDPVALGRARAKQARLGGATESVLPVLLHGDAAFAGQGITAETLNLAEISGFRVGGTVHLIVDNRIGFTAEPAALHSGRFASDLAKRLAAPIFHVNGEDPAAALRAGRLATEYRYAFGSDSFVDLIGFRRHGHSEIDDPTLTQPLLYEVIRSRPAVWRRFAESVGADPGFTRDLSRQVRSELDAARREAEALESAPALSRLPDYWTPFVGGPYREDFEVATALEPAAVRRLGERLTAVPDGFHIHPKAAKLLAARREMTRGERDLDFGTAEALALASLVESGVPVRLSGQDSRRGTFSHRHAILVDVVDATEYCPLRHVAPDQAAFEIYDSVLSEAAVMGFEYGYSRDAPETLVLWEAQFGDFANGAQVILDQFVTAGEDKWGLLSGLVLLLPHGFEGQGPEHSSARIERYLQLAAEDAIQVAQPSTAAQYFHLLRRQALRRWRKPLIVFTPKSLLRHAAAASAVADLATAFRPVLADEGRDAGARRILLCTGKVAHELRAERRRRQDDATAVVTLEQLYPFPEAELEAALGRFPQARRLVWVQEEPANMGALAFVMPRLERVAGRRHVASVKRSPSASPATGSPSAHRLEQQALIQLAFS